MRGLSVAVQGRSGCVPAVAVVNVTTHNFATLPLDRYFDYAVGTEVALSNVYLRAGEGIVFHWSPETTEYSTCSPIVTLAR